MSKKVTKKTVKKVAKKAVKKVAKKAVKKVAKKVVKKVAKKAVKKAKKKAVKKVAKKLVTKEMKSKKHEFAIFFQEPPGHTNAGGFFFFDEISELNRYLVNIYAYFQYFDEESKDKLVGRILDFKSKYKKEDLTNDLIAKVEEVIENCFDIPYLGKTSDLAFSMDNFSKKVRTRFRKSEEYENPDAIKPIEESELKDFFSYVSGYYHG